MLGSCSRCPRPLPVGGHFTAPLPVPGVTSWAWDSSPGHLQALLKPVFAPSGLWGAAVRVWGAKAGGREGPDLSGERDRSQGRAGSSFCLLLTMPQPGLFSPTLPRTREQRALSLICILSASLRSASVPLTRFRRCVLCCSVLFPVFECWTDRRTRTRTLSLPGHPFTPRLRLPR